MAVEVATLLPVIIFGALLDSINPCVIGVMILLLTVLLKSGDRRKLLVNGLVYTGGKYFTYLIGGVTLLAVFSAARGITLVGSLLYLVIGGFVIFAAFAEIKDYFWYGRGFSLAILPRFIKTIESTVQKTHASLAAAFGFGIAVTLIELPCTGAPYLAVLSLMSFIPLSVALPLLLLYNLIFILPLIAILLLAYKGVGVKTLEKWRKKNRPVMRLFIGLFMLALGLWIISIIALEATVFVAAAIGIIIAVMFIAKKVGL